MDRFLVTHSLLSSWLYAIQDNPYEDATTERDPMAEFLTVLRREPTPTSDAMQKGIDFENLVTAILSGAGDQTNEWYYTANRVASIIRGGILQYAAKTPVRIGDRDVLLYGRLDALKGGVIYDIKYSGHYEAGKYFDSTQHPMYLRLVPEAREFSYLISNGKEFWQETYRREETASIDGIVANFYEWLNVQGLDGLYRQHWQAL